MPEPKENKGGGASAPRSARARAEYRRPEVTGVKYDRSAERDTEAGLTPEQIRTLLAEEDRWRTAFGGRYEIAGVVGQDGTLNPRGNPMVRRSRYGRIEEAQHGTAEKVTTRVDRRPADSIFTHFHPRSRSDLGLGQRIGISLSGPDIGNAVRLNHSAVRAYTGSYVFSLQRPAGGWPVSGDKIEREWTAAYERETREMLDFINRGNFTNEEKAVRMGRLNALASHRATKEVAKRYGLRYTRRRVR